MTEDLTLLKVEKDFRKRYLDIIFKDKSYEYSLEVSQSSIELRQRQLNSNEPFTKIPIAPNRQIVKAIVDQLLAEKMITEKNISRLGGLSLALKLCKIQNE